MTSPFADPSFVPGLLADAQTAGIAQFVVGALITDKERILLLRRKPDDFLGGLWELPGGGIEEGESVEEAVLRETLEETGLLVSGITAYLGHFDYVSSRGDLHRQYTFAVAVEKAAPILLTEHDDHTWADRGELPGVSDDVRELITRWTGGTGNAGVDQSRVCRADEGVA